MNPMDEEKSLQIVGAASNPIVAQVWRLADPLCRSEGFMLVFVEFQRESSGQILRIFLDKPGGITLDDCANVSRQLSDLLDVGLDIDGSYRLEVSSPGVQRPLGKLDDFQRFIGEKIKIKTVQQVNGQKNFTGVLDGVHQSMIQIDVDKKAVAIAFDDIKKAHLIHDNGES